jgi:hypothetical protein
MRQRQGLSGLISLENLKLLQYIMLAIVFTLCGINFFTGIRSIVTFFFVKVLPAYQSLIHI